MTAPSITRTQFELLDLAVATSGYLSRAAVDNGRLRSANALEKRGILKWEISRQAWKVTDDGEYAHGIAMCTRRG